VITENRPGYVDKLQTGQTSGGSCKHRSSDGY
jgi:hypothetical protein